MPKESVQRSEHFLIARKRFHLLAVAFVDPGNVLEGASVVILVTAVVFAFELLNDEGDVKVVTSELELSAGAIVLL